MAFIHSLCFYTELQELNGQGRLIVKGQDFMVAGGTIQAHHVSILLKAGRWPYWNTP